MKPYSIVFKSIQVTVRYIQGRSSLERTLSSIATRRHYAPRARYHPASREGFTENTSDRSFDPFVRANTGKRQGACRIYTFEFGSESIVFFEISFGPRGHRTEPRGRVRRLHTRGLNARTTNTRGKNKGIDGFAVVRAARTDGATMVGDRRRRARARRCF